MAVRKSSLESFDDGATVIGEGIQVRGRVEGEEDLRVHGSVEGSISLTETLYVEDGGLVQATVEARDVVVSGIVIGDVSAGNSITLNAGAKLVGNIKAPRVIIADGAAFRGDVSMGDTPISTVPRSKTATAPRKASRGGVSTASAARSRPAPARPAARSEAAKPAKPRAAQRPSRSSDDDDEVTVVIKHAALRKGQAPPDDDEPAARPKAKAKVRAAAPKKKSKKKAARARVPARGKRRVSRR